MSVVDLNPDETVALVTPRAKRSISDLGREQKRALLNRLIKILESAAPSHYIEKEFSDTEKLQQIRIGNTLRGYCRLVTNLPGYNLLLIFEISKHNYRNLSLYDERAKQKLAEIDHLQTEEDVESYIESNEVMRSSDFRAILEDL